MPRASSSVPGARRSPAAAATASAALARRASGALAPRAFLPTLAYNLTAPVRMPLAAARAGASLGAKAANRASSLVFPRGFGGLQWPSWDLLFGGRGRRMWGQSWRESQTFDYARAVGDGSGNSILAACLNVLADAVPEPGPPKVYREDAQGEYDAVPDHALTLLLRRPNPFMPWEELAKILVVYQHLYGECYFFKVRSGAGRVVELWPIHPAHIAPQWPQEAANTQWITHYLYAPNGLPITLAVEDIVHLPLQRDPDDPRRGRSPLRTLFLELFTAQEVGHFQAALLRNLGIPGVVLSPDASAGRFSPENADLMKERLVAGFSGDRRGEPMVLSGPMNVSVLSFSPKEMDLQAFNSIPESRISAVLGVPAILAHLKVGLENGTYNNLAGLKEHFTQSKLVPYWRLIAAQLTLSLLPDFGGDAGAELRFDISEVKALQPDMTAMFQRLDLAVRGGWVQVNEARRDVGMLEVPGGDIFYVPLRVAPTTGEQLADLPAMVDPAAYVPPQPGAQPAVQAASAAAAAPPPPGAPDALATPAPSKAMEEALAAVKAAETHSEEAAAQHRLSSDRLEAHLALLGRSLQTMQAEVAEVRATAARVEAKQIGAALEQPPPIVPPAVPPPRMRKIVRRDEQGRITEVLDIPEPPDEPAPALPPAADPVNAEVPAAK